MKGKKKNHKTFVVILNGWFGHPQQKTSEENPICLHLPVEHVVNLGCRRLQLQTTKTSYNNNKGTQTGLWASSANTSEFCIAVVGVLMWRGTKGETRVVLPTTRAVIIPIYRVWTSMKTLIMSSPLWEEQLANFSRIAARNYAVLWGCGRVVGTGNAKESGGGGAH